MKLFIWYGLPMLLLVTFASMVIELTLLRAFKKTPDYSYKESLTTLRIITIAAFTNGILTSTIGAILYYFYQHRVIEPMPLSKWLIVPMGIFCSEFIQYWSHRYGHRMRLGWLHHVVHHTSKHMNVFTAQRHGFSLFSSFSWVPSIPLALMGFPPWTIGFYFGLEQTYQLLVHTELNPRLGWLEYIFVTPSHHRVHHGTHSKYLGKNYGGMLIIFDRIFGTFQAEDPSIAKNYGIKEPVDPNRVLDSALCGYRHLWRDATAAPGIWNKVKILYMPPEWKPLDQALPTEKSGNEIAS